MGYEVKFTKSWGFHNIVAHPIMQICNWLGSEELAIKIHDSTLPQLSKSPIFKELDDQLVLMSKGDFKQGFLYGHPDRDKWFNGEMFLGFQGITPEYCDKLYLDLVHDDELIIVQPEELVGCSVNGSRVTFPIFSVIQELKKGIPNDHYKLFNYQSSPKFCILWAMIFGPTDELRQVVIESNDEKSAITWINQVNDDRSKLFEISMIAYSKK